jgi:hypothetical protein
MKMSVAATVDLLVLATLGDVTQLGLCCIIHGVHVHHGRCDSPILSLQQQFLYLPWLPWVMLHIQDYVASSMVAMSTMDVATQSFPVIAATVALLALATLGDVTNLR